MTDQTPETIKDASDVLSTVPRIQNPSSPDYADQKRMFQGIPGLATTPNNRLWATCHSGGVIEDQDNYVMLATRSDCKLLWPEDDFSTVSPHPTPECCYRSTMLMGCHEAAES